MTIDQVRPQTERITELVDRFCQAVADGGTARLLTPQDLHAALPLAIARYISITALGGDRHHQIAAAEALLRHLGCGLLSASYDRATIAGLFEKVRQSTGELGACQTAAGVGAIDINHCHFFSASIGTCRERAGKHLGGRPSIRIAQSLHF